MKENKARDDDRKCWRHRVLGFGLKVAVEQDLTVARDQATWVIWEQVMLEKVV